MRVLKSTAINSAAMQARFQGMMLVQGTSCARGFDPLDQEWSRCLVHPKTCRQRGLVFLRGLRGVGGQRLLAG